MSIADLLKRRPKQLDAAEAPADDLTGMDEHAFDFGCLIRPAKPAANAPVRPPTGAGARHEG